MAFTDGAISEWSPMYVGYIGAGGTERHISLVPHVPGLEAICGQLVRTTRPVPWHAALAVATCNICRTRGVEVARRILANDPPRDPSTASIKQAFPTSARSHRVEYRRASD